MQEVSGGLLILSCLVFSLSTAVGGGQAATYYVGTNGSNTTGDGSIGNPYRTITYAAMHGHGGSPLQPGDTLYIRAGTYEEMVVLNDAPRGTPSQPITIAGYPGEARPVIRPASGLEGDHAFELTYPGDPEDPYRHRFSSYVTLRDFAIDGINLPNNSGCLRIWTDHVTVDNLYLVNAARNGISFWTSHSTVRNCHIKDAGRIQPPADADTKGPGLYTGGHHNVIEHNLFEGCRSGGPVVHGQPTTCDNIIRYNIIRGFGLRSSWPPPADRPDFRQYGTGITIGHGQRNRAYNNIIYAGAGNGSQGLLFWASTSNNEIYNNTIYDVDVGVQIGLVGDHGHHNAIRNNIFSGVGAVILINSDGANPDIGHNLANPPVSAIFVDAAGGDFHLIPGSAAIDAGMALPAVPDDYDGIARPQGAAYDIGAYEYQAGDSSVPDS